MTTVGLPTDRPIEHFGMACEGYLSVPADGLYTFALRSADGSELRLDGERVVLDDAVDFITRRGEVALKAGLHPLELRYFHRTFVAGLELKVEAPGTPLVPVTARQLFHLVGGR